MDSIQRRAIVFPASVVGSVVAGFRVVRQDATGLAYVAEDARPISTRVNVDRARIVGFEAEAAVELSPSWTARAFMAMSNGEVTATNEPLRRMPPPIGGASARWARGRVWIEATTNFAASQTRLNPADLSDGRIGGNRTRASIASYFSGSGTDSGLVQEGRLIATGETLSQVQDRVLAGAAAAPLFVEGRGYLIVGARGGIRLTSQIEVTVIGENLADSNYRQYGSGLDGPGLNIQARIRYRF